ncbi:hypothetical protein [Streptomyces cinereoruber]|uniref:ApeA N-terminal domain 1-containing protein n=1 Tax=Streptomyces cinereoruber TaxID=67260 RepID=UPI003C2E8E76
MVIKKLKHGDSVTGLIVDDGLPDTPYVAATLTYDEQSGIRLEVPYMYGVEQFGHVEDWFTREQPPRNLQFATRDGIASLYDCRYAGHTMAFSSGFTLAFIRPQEVVSAVREGELSDPLKVRELSSELDGLPAWTRFKSIKHETGVNDEGRIQKVSITVEGQESTSWTQGDALMEMRTGWSTGSQGTAFNVSEWVSLNSAFTAPRPLSDHLREQRKVAAFLKFMFGRQVSFRRHQVRDDRFPEYSLAGDARSQLPLVDMITRRTFKEFASPKPETKKLHPLVHFTEIGAEGLERWGTDYDTWGRFILPAASALSRRGDALENDVLSFSMSLEAAGSIIGAVAGEEDTLNKWGRPTTATYSYRCIASLGIDWKDIAQSPTGLARALSNNYNTIKHYDRGEFPDFTETYLVSEVLKMTVRLIALKIAHQGDELRKKAANRILADVKQAFHQQDLCVNESGAFVEAPS